MKVDITHLLDEDVVEQFNKSDLFFKLKVDENKLYQGEITIYYKYDEWKVAEGDLHINQELMKDHDKLTAETIKQVSLLKESALKSGKWIEWVDSLPIKE